MPTQQVFSFLCLPSINMSVVEYREYEVLKAIYMLGDGVTRNPVKQDDLRMMLGIGADRIQRAMSELMMPIISPRTLFRHPATIGAVEYASRDDNRDTRLRVTKFGEAALKRAEAQVRDDLLISLAERPDRSIAENIEMLPIETGRIIRELQWLVTEKRNWVEAEGPSKNRILTKAGQAALAAAKRRRELPLFGLINPRKIMEEGLHGAGVQLITYILTFLAGVGATVLWTWWRNHHP